MLSTLLAVLLGTGIGYALYWVQICATSTPRAPHGGDCAHYWQSWEVHRPTRYSIRIYVCEKCGDTYTSPTDHTNK
jgi:hypothetical protein